MTSALVLVDVQHDFSRSWGAVPAKFGQEVVPVCNALLEESCLFCVRVASQDYHPEGHISFASRHGQPVGSSITEEGRQQMLFKDHCVQGTKGAELDSELRVDLLVRVVQKGSNKDVEAYSALYDVGRRHSTGLADYLRDRGVEAVFVAGLVTEVCVRATVLDAIEEGFKTSVVLDACRPANFEPGSEQAALLEMWVAGAKAVFSKDLLGQRTSVEVGK